MATDREALDAYSEVVINAAKRIGPTVVQIETNRVPRGFNPYSDRNVAGLGSGFIFNSEGLILTNAHVVANAAQINVKFADGRTFPAQLVRAEQREDLAVIRINAKERLPVAELTATPLQPGQLVVAIGNPFGLGWSVTAGVVSAVGRPLDSPQDGISLQNLIQTQTPINPGNSGGPLVNGAGKVVGITTAIVPFAQGIGFAIPVDNIYTFLSRANEPSPSAANRVTMGVAIQPVTFDPNIAQQLPTHQQGGVLIIEVVAGSSAAQGGLHSRDIILTADGRTVQDPRELSAIVQSHKPGDKLTLTFLRDYRVRQVTLVLA
jgi:serine protease Do